MTIRFRLFGFVISLSVLLIGISYFATFITMDILSKAEGIYVRQFAALDSLHSLSRNLCRVDQAIGALRSDASRNGAPAGDVDVPAAMREAKEILRAFTESRAGASEDDLALTDRINALFSEWETMANGIVRGSGYGGDYGTTLGELYATLDALADAVAKQAEGNYWGVRKYGFTLFVSYHAFAAMGALLGIFILVTIYRSVLKPIKNVSGRVQSLASGEGVLTQRIPVIGNDEMALLAKNLNDFIGKTESILISLRSSIREANAIKAGTVSSISENGAATVQITANVQSIAKQISSLEGVVREAGETTARLDRIVRLFDTQILDQAAMSEQSSSSVSQMIGSVGNLSRIAAGRKKGAEDLSRKISEGDVKIQASASSVQAIHGDIDTILEMVHLISGIASQTNLLAMNAAIEAAHAGSSGRGFAVVADEIRKLAETSSDQAKSIGGVLSKIVKNIEAAKDASVFTSSVYRDIQSEFKILIDAFSEISSNSSELDAGGKQILETMERLNGHSKFLRKESSELNGVNSDMAEMMGRISEISCSVDSSIKEIHNAMGDISNGMTEMNSMAINLDRSMVTAQEQLGRFKLSE